MSSATHHCFANPNRFHPASTRRRFQLRAFSLVGSLLLLTASAVRADFAVAWESSIDSGATDRAKAIGYMTNGDVIVACQVGGSGSTANFRVVRLNGTTGTEVWHTDVDAGSGDDANDMVVNPSTGDAYVCGRTSVTGQGLNWAVFKIRGSDGQLIWTYTWNGPYSGGNDEPRAIAFTSDGNVAVVGMLTTASGYPQGRIAKLNASTGAEIWAYVTGTDWTDLYDVAGDSAGNVIATGTSGSVSTADGYVTKITSAGALSWTKTYNRAGDYDTFTVVTVDASDNIIIGGGSRTTSTSTTQDFLVIKYTSSGSQSWVALINGSANLSDACYGVTTDASGDVYATGGIRNASDQNAYIAKLNGSTGAVIWDKDCGGSASGTDNFRAVRVVGSGVITAGQFANANGDIGVAQFNTATGAQDWLVYFNSAANVSDNQYFKRQMTVVDATNVFVCGDSSGNGIVAKIAPAAPANAAPTDIALSSGSVNQSGGVNATVGMLSTTDADTGDSHTYSLVAGTGSTDNASFNISGSTLRANNATALAAGNYSVRIRTDDGNGGTYEEAFTIVVADDIAPVVTSVGVPANGTYRIGQDLDFTVNFDENVTVNTSGGTPRIPVTLDTGGTVDAGYLSGSGTTALLFRHTIASGTLDGSGIAVGVAIAANGGTLQDAAFNNAALTLNSVGSTAGVLVDGVAPTVQSITRKTPVLQYTSTNQVVFQVTFSEAVNAPSTSFFAVTPVNGATVTGGVSSVTGGPQTYDVTVNLTSGSGEFKLNLTNPF